MTAPTRAVRSTTKRPRKSAPETGAVNSKLAARKRVHKRAHKRARKSATQVAIATELAPAVAIALLDKTEQPPGAPAPALDCLAAAAAPSDIDGKVRVQLLFENGAVLPVEMSNAAGAALSKGLADQVPKK